MQLRVRETWSAWRTRKPPQYDVAEIVFFPLFSYFLFFTHFAWKHFIRREASRIRLQAKTINLLLKFLEGIEIKGGDESRLTWDSWLNVKSKLRGTWRWDVRKQVSPSSVKTCNYKYGNGNSIRGAEGASRESTIENSCASADEYRINVMFPAILRIAGTRFTFDSRYVKCEIHPVAINKIRIKLSSGYDIQLATHATAALAQLRRSAAEMREMEPQTSEEAAFRLWTT